MMEAEAPVKGSPAEELPEEPGRKKNLKGIRIRTVNFIMIGISCGLYVLLILATIHVSIKYDDVHVSMEDYIQFQDSDALLTEGSAYLTDQVRQYTVTKDPQHMDAYFKEVHETRRREQALESIQQTHGEEQAYAFLVEALDRSNDLMEREIYAMGLIARSEGAAEASLPEEVRAVELTAEDLALSPEEMVDKARDMVFGEEYQTAKAEIGASVERSMDSIHEKTHLEMVSSAQELERTMSRQRILLSALFFGTIITFLMIILLIVKPLQIYVKCIKEDKMMEIVGSYEFKYLALTYNDIYEVNAANETMLRHQAEHDPLTGIINRSAFEHLRRLFQAKASPMALLLVDVDKFKQVNDGYGHEMGDRVLKRVAQLLEESFRNTDYPARIGGDEFAVIMPDIGPDQWGVIEHKVTEMNRRLTCPIDGLPQVSLSVGVAFSPKGFTDDLYRKADLALYEVKEHGRCGCRAYGQSAPEGPGGSL